MNIKISGHSFIEVLFILIISSVISLYSISAISLLWQNQNKSRYLLKLEQAIIFARNYAITHHTNVTMQASTQDWALGIKITDNDHIILRLPKLPAGHQLSLVAFPNSTRLQFDSQGILNCNNGTFTYTLPNYEKTYLKISKTGRVRYEAN